MAAGTWKGMWQHCDGGTAGRAQEEWPVGGETLRVTVQQRTWRTLEVIGCQPGGHHVVI